MSNTSTSMQHLTIQSIVQLLLSSDVHLIITHMHQGIMELLRWNMTDLVLELQLLYSHPGYPTGRSLEDPIFLQDKFKYQSQFIPSHRLCELSRHRTPERLSDNYCLLRWCSYEALLTELTIWTAALILHVLKVFKSVLEWSYAYIPYLKFHNSLFIYIRLQHFIIALLFCSWYLRFSFAALI